MKHKLWIAFFTVAMTLSLALGLTACDLSDFFGAPDDSGANENPTPTEGFCYNELYGEDGTTVIGYFVGIGNATDEKEIVIPATHNDLPVLYVSATEEFLLEQLGDDEFNEESEGYYEFIRSYTFMYCENLETVTILGVPELGYGAFQGCAALTSVIIGNGTTTIGEAAFVDCENLSSIIISDSVTTIKGQAFQNCSSLTNIIIPNSVTSIGDYAFTDCYGLENVTLPNSVTEIGLCAFRWCENLTSIIYQGTIEEWKAIEKEDWNDASSITSVVCTNGTLTVDDIE